MALENEINVGDFSKVVGYGEGQQDQCCLNNFQQFAWLCVHVVIRLTGSSFTLLVDR